MNHSLAHEDLARIAAAFDGISYGDVIELDVGDLMLGGSSYARFKQLMALGMSFANLIDLMAKNEELLIGMTVSVYFEDRGDWRTLTLLIIPHAKEKP